ncbi:MAG: hypothetical protein [Caudoviricetes sp.]|nr:MAG: hypothetical protein [Caudoviricetes sp.]
MLIFLIKYWWQIFLFFLISMLLLIVNVQHSKISSLKKEHAQYIKEQEQVQLKLQVESKDKLLNAEKQYSEQLKKISTDADRSNASASRLSKQLTEANARLKTARREAIEEYSRKQSDVLSNCITEYRNMAKIADEYRANAEKNAL